MEASSKAQRVLIVGQGLAGTAIAWCLWRRQVPFLVVDAEEASSSSKVAAGLITPITGLRVNKSWKLEELYAFAEAHYHEVESLLGTQFFSPCSVVRCIKSEFEMNRWKKRWVEPEYMAWVQKAELETQDYPTWLLPSMGGFEQKGAAWLDTQKYLSASREFFKSLGSYQKATLKEEALVVTEDSVAWGTESFSHVALARGWQQKDSPFFDWLDFNSARGVIATVTLDGVDATQTQDQVIHHHAWIQTRSDRAWRCGSTYEFDYQRPLEESLNELKEKLEKTVNVPFQLSDAAVGVRPIVRKRSLVVGKHPAYARIGILNGLGSKGTLRSPYFAQVLCEALLDGKEVDPEVEVR